MKKKTSNKNSFRKEIKAPDAFQVKAIEGMSLIEKNKKVIISAGVSLIALVTISIGVEFWQNRSEKELKKQMAIAEKVYFDELKETDEKRKSIQKQIEGLKSSDKDNKKDSNDADKEQLKKLEKTLEEIEPVHDESIEAFKKFYDAHQKKPEGFVAGMKYASLIVKKGKFSEAKKVLSNIVSSSTGWPLFQIHGRLSLMSIQEDLKELDQAVLTADKLILIAPQDLKGKVMIAKTRILLEANKKDEAIKTLDLLLKDYPASPEAENARSLKAIIERG